MVDPDPNPFTVIGYIDYERVGWQAAILARIGLTSFGFVQLENEVNFSIYILKPGHESPKLLQPYSVIGSELTIGDLERMLNSELQDGPRETVEFRIAQETENYTLWIRVR